MSCRPTATHPSRSDGLRGVGLLALLALLAPAMPAAAEVIHLRLAATLAAAEPEALGHALALGDVDGDGLADALVGAPDAPSGGAIVGRAALHLSGACGTSEDAAWEVLGASDGARLGAAVALADLDEDGFADALIGVPGAGRVELYLGSPGGLSSVPAWTFTSAQPDGELGFALAAGGDADSDGIPDVLVGEPAHDGLGVDAGRVLIFRGAAGGLPATPDGEILGSQAGGRLGEAVAWAGDVDADGFGDALVGEPYHDADAADGGRAALHRGGPGGVDATAAWNGTGSQAGERFGSAVAGLGDLDDDGHADVAVGSPRRDDGAGADHGAVSIHAGAPDGRLDTAWLELVGSSSGDWFGAALAVGDLDGDGQRDLLVGAPHADANGSSRGAVVAFAGVPGGLSPLVGARLLGPSAGALLGTALATGDVDGDGLDDVMAGAPERTAADGARGWVEVHRGMRAGWGPDPDWTSEGTSVDGTVVSIAEGCDVNGDGHDDLLLLESDVGGRLHAFFGSAGGLDTTSGWSVSESEGGRTACAGDVNGDGFDDVLHAVRLYLGSPSGPLVTSSWDVGGERTRRNLAAPGDVNGDGFDDVLVAKPGMMGSEFPPVEGFPARVLLFLGGPSGLDASPSWSLEGPDDRDLRYRVASVGDIDADGLAEIAIIDDYEETLAIHRGRPAGPNDAPDWVLPSENDPPPVDWGYPTVSGGDVDGDGHSDLIIASESSVRWHAGTPDGPSLARVAHLSTPEGAPRRLSAAGDVDGDGRSETILGGPDSPGRARVQWGASFDCPADEPSTLIESTDTGDAMGSSVAFGDVNGDGLDDLAVVGALQAHVFLAKGAPGPLTMTCVEPSALDLRPGAVPLEVSRLPDGRLWLTWEGDSRTSDDIHAGALAALGASSPADAAAIVACDVQGGAVVLDDVPGNAFFLASAHCARQTASLGRSSDGASRGTSGPGCP